MAGRDAATDFRLLANPCTIGARAVVRQEHQNQGSDSNGGTGNTYYTCSDDWQYSFCLGGEDSGSGDVNPDPSPSPSPLDALANPTCSPAYTSKTERISVCDGFNLGSNANRHAGFCERCKETSTPTFTVSQQTKCWEPTPEFVEISSKDNGGSGIERFPYSCGNFPCYKIFDPQDDLDGAETLGAILIPLGAVFTLMALSLFYFTYRGWKRHKSHPGEITNYGGAYGEATTVQEQQQRIAQQQQQQQQQQQAGGVQMMAQPMAGYPQAAGYPQTGGYPQAAGAAQTMSVQVPPGMQGGMPMQVQTPAGVMQVQVPPGLQPGMAFQIQVPGAQPAMATAVAQPM